MNRLRYVLTVALAVSLMGAVDGSKPSAKPTAPKDKTAQTSPADTDNGVRQTRDGTLPPPDGTGPNAFIGFRVRTEGEDVVFESNCQRDLKSTGQFYVQIEPHQGDVEPGGSELAREAARQIGLARPRNTLGRKLAFPRWHTVKNGSNYDGPIVPLGWSLLIREVTPLPDGWQAVVLVFPIARTGDGRNFTAYNYLLETYRFKDGKLKLEFEAPNPMYDARDGLWGWVKY